MRVIDPATRAAFVGVQQLIADYWNEIDANDARDASDFYTEACRFAPGNGVTYEGRGGVRAFYADRARRGKRTTRHVGLNLTLALEAPDRARGAYLVAHYAADGPEPVVDYAGPSAVVDLDCAFERGADGQWRFARVHSTPIFIGREPYVRAALIPGE